MVFYEEKLMADNKQSDGCILNCSTSSGSSVEVKPLRGSWAEEMQRNERKLEQSHSQSLSKGRLVEPLQSHSKEAKPEREIALEFLDDANEHKFERLLKEEKLRTPFKRRHSDTGSNESRSNSPSGSSCDEGADGAGSGPVEGKGFREKFQRYRDEKRPRHCSLTSSCSSSSYTENDPAILMRRQKQIDYGKNTVAYDCYMEKVPRSERTRDHPKTPNKYGKYSRRAFDGLVKIWRKQLHHYDPPTNKSVTDADAGEMSSDDSD